MCELNYIPEHLKEGELIVIPEFKNNELLFFRCPPEKLYHPYNISLIDLSHNRNFDNPDKYESQDVLWNTDPTKDFERYIDKEIVILSLDISENKETINFRFNSFKDENYYVDIVLKHKPIPCNCAHSTFEISFNDTIVNWDNWEETLGLNKGPKKGVSKELRNDLRQFLTKMIISNKASNDGFEIVN